MVFLGLRSTIKDDLGISPAETAYGKSLFLPGQLFVKIRERPIGVEFVVKLKKMMAFLRHEWGRGPKIAKQP